MDIISHLFFPLYFIIFAFEKENGFWVYKKTFLLHYKGWKKVGKFLSSDLYRKNISLGFYGCVTERSSNMWRKLMEL